LINVSKTTIRMDGVAGDRDKARRRRRKSSVAKIARCGVAALRQGAAAPSSSARPEAAQQVAQILAGRALAGRIPEETTAAIERAAPNSA
jgi:hypothetical protein